MTQSNRSFENIFAVISLLLFSQGFFPIIIGGDNFEGGDIDSPLLRIIFSLIYFITIFLLTSRWQRTLAFLGTNLWLLFLIILAIVSVYWSSIPDIAFRKMIALVGTTSFGIYLASSYNFREQLKIYSWVFGISVVFSLLFAIALPQYGIMNTEAITGAWRGIYPHKNGLGGSMFISFMAFYFLATSAKQYRLLFQIFCLLSVVLTYFAESATSLMSILFIFAVSQGLQYLSLKDKRSVLLILLFLITVSILLFVILINFNTFLSVNNKDVTLSGRTTLWDSLWQFIKQKPWLGYGYGSFFSGVHRETDLLWKVHNWSPVHAHNGYVQVLLHFGFVGLIPLVFGYIHSLFISLYKYLVFKSPHMLWIFLYLIYTVFLNFTEVSFFSTNSITWIVTIASFYSIKTKTVAPNPQVVTYTS
ncbi:MAG: O-antigen ligase family protein [Waterburya sp.]